MLRLVAIALALSLWSAQAASQAIGLREELRIGEVDGQPPYELSRVSAIAVGAGGTLYVVNGASASIRVFGADGRFVREIGRRGGGPGEFQMFSVLALNSDTLFVLDMGNRRHTLLSTAGAVLTSWPADFDRESRTMINAIGRAPGGWYVLPFTSPAPGRAGDAQVMNFNIAFTADPTRGLRSEQRPVVSFPWQRSFMIPIAGGPGGVTSSTPLFEAVGRYVVDGRGLVYVSRGDPYRIEVYGADGKLVRTLQRTHRPVPVTRELVERYRREVELYFDTARAQHGEWHIGRSAAEGKGKLPTGRNLPALGRMIVSSGGTLIVERPDLVADPVLPELPAALVKPQPSTYDLFDPAGRFLGSLTFAAAFRPLAVTENAVVGVLRDELDVERVVRYGFLLLGAR